MSAGLKYPCVRLLDDGFTRLMVEFIDDHTGKVIEDTSLKREVGKVYNNFAAVTNTRMWKSLEEVNLRNQIREAEKELHSLNAKQAKLRKAVESLKKVERELENMESFVYQI